MMESVKGSVRFCYSERKKKTKQKKPTVLAGLIEERRSRVLVY